MALDTADLENMTSAEICQSLKTIQLEQAYERALQQSDRIYKEERERAFRVQVLLLEDENDVLQDQLAESEAQIEKLEDCHDDLRENLMQTKADLQRTQVDLKSRLRDIDHYRAELNNLSTMSSDSTKLLTEKLSLARELAVLKPEIEHLRSQTVTQQNLLAEKLALQRELSTLQVELETEKRAVQRTKAKDNKSSEDESKLEAQIEELKKELSKEKREAQKNDRDARKQAADWEGQKTILESKLDAFRNKLRSTKEQLKETQTELEQAQAARATREAEFAEARPSAANPRKRPVARFDPDATIGTPGVAAKKPRSSAMPGDKSTFSITPFLNRTMSLAPESPASQEKEVDEAINEQINAIIAGNATSSPAPAPKSKPVKRTATGTAAKAKEPQPLKDTTNPKANVNVQKQRNTATSKTALAKVTEEADENEEPTENPPAPPSIQKKQPVKKKQKLLGQRKSLFDDDDDEGERSKPKGMIGLSKGLGLRGGAGIGPISLGGKGKMLAEFSPLKKDRRAAAAAVGAASPTLTNLPESSTHLTYISTSLEVIVRVMLSGNGLKSCRALIGLAFGASRPSNRVICRRFASSKRWVERQSKDRFAREARVQGLKSRAAFKLLQINDKYRLFKPGQTVVDLGYAPGSWSQVAIELTKPYGRVLGVDIIPTQPPKGVSTIQGNFLSPEVQNDIKHFLRDPDRGRLRRKNLFASSEEEAAGAINAEALEELERGYIDLEKEESAHVGEDDGGSDSDAERTVDVVLSDMCEPWEQTTGFWKRSLTDPYLRMMNTSGNNFRDHAGSMDLCRAALEFSFETLKTGGHFVCKFYQGAEDKLLEKALKLMFHKVHREKPESSRSESKEAYFVGLKRLAKADKNAVFHVS